MGGRLMNRQVCPRLAVALGWPLLPLDLGRLALDPLLQREGYSSARNIFDEFALWHPSA